MFTLGKIAEWSMSWGVKLCFGWDEISAYYSFFVIGDLVIWPPPFASLRAWLTNESTWDVIACTFLFCHPSGDNGLLAVVQLCNSPGISLVYLRLLYTKFSWFACIRICSPCTRHDTGFLPLVLPVGGEQLKCKQTGSKVSCISLARNANILNDSFLRKFKTQWSWKKAFQNI